MTDRQTQMGNRDERQTQRWEIGTRDRQTQMEDRDDRQTDER